MIANKYNEYLKHKRLGSKLMGGNKIGNKFGKPSHDLAIHKEYSEGEKPVKVALHDTSDLGFNVKNKPSSHLEKAKHESKLFYKGV
jgi:hypothetical protein